MPARPTRRAALLALLAALALPGALTACASAGGAGAEADGSEPRPARSSNRLLLTAADLEGTAHPNLLDAVNALRGHWLRAGGSSTISSGGSAAGSAQTLVYLNGQPLGGVEALRQITPRTVQTARYLTTSEAQSRYGSRVVSPVIDVVLRQ